MKSIFSEYIKSSGNKITLSVGVITLIEKIGEGGNGIVYEGEIYGKRYALKFLVPSVKGKSYKRKIARFLAEYFNIMTISESTGIVKYVDYDILVIDKGDETFSIPVIIMKKYNHSLQALSEENLLHNFECIFNFLLSTLDKIHKEGIIHRDLKPENILVDDQGYVLADFGIASYNPDIFKLRAETKSNERIGNRLFSAPEQERGGIVARETMDIYSIGQILHWLIFSETHRGTNRKKISNKYPELQKYDLIIETCLSNNPDDRFQSINEIRERLNGFKTKQKDFWTYLYDFGNILAENFPKNEIGIVHSNNLKRIDRLFSSIKENEGKFGEQLWWHNGLSNTHFVLTHKGVGQWKLNDKELIIKEIWLHYDLSFFNDFIIVHFEKGTPFIVNDEEQYYNIFVDDEHEITYSEYENNFAEINDQVIDLKNHKVEFIKREEKEGLLIIATNFHCAVTIANDKTVREFFNKLESSKYKLEIEEFQKFERTIRVNKYKKVIQDL